MSVAFENRWKAFFELIDQSKNGLIGAGDVPFIEKTLRTNAHFNETQIAEFVAAASTLISEFVKIAGGKDKKVSLPEWLGEAKKHIGQDYSTAPAWFHASFNKIFDAIDTNKNGIFCEDEVVTLANSVIPQLEAENPGVIRQTYKQQVQGDLDKATALQVIWNYLTTDAFMPQDVILYALLNIFNPPPQ